MTSDTPAARALALIAPPGDRQQWCREALGQYTKMIADANKPPATRETKAQLSATAKSLRVALETIKKLPRSEQRRLLPDRARSSERIKTSSIMDLIADDGLTDLSLELFLNELALAAANAEIRSMRLRVPRSGGRPNYRKQAAAELALLLLVRFDRQPTLTPDGPFFNLASVLYEAATGRKDANLERQCRDSHASHRRWLRQQSPASTDGQRKK